MQASTILDLCKGIIVLLYWFLVYVGAFFDEKARVHHCPATYVILQFDMEEKIDEY